MKKIVVAIVLVASALLATPLQAAKPKVDRKIFAGRFNPDDIFLSAASGDYVVYSRVKLRMSKKGKLTGSASRFDSISSETITVSISGSIKGRAKLRGKGKEKYALAKGTVTFSDGATCEGQFASRNFKTGKRFQALSPGLQRGMFLSIVLNLLGQSFLGSMFVGVK